MSHVVTIQCEVNDLEALSAAAQELGMELSESKTYKWYGRFMGDWKLPEGFSSSDLGKCDHVLRVKGAGPETYEVGVVKRRDGKPGYNLLFDFWSGGFGLVDKIGENAVNLKREYALAVAAKEMRRNGFRVSRQIDQKTGKPKMIARRTR